MPGHLLLAGLLLISAAHAGELRHGGPVTSVVRFQDGFLSGGFDGRVLIWNDDLKPVREILEMSAPIKRIAAWRDQDSNFELVMATTEHDRSLWTGDKNYVDIQSDRPLSIATVSNQLGNDVCFAQDDGSVLCTQPLKDRARTSFVSKSGKAAASELALLNFAGERRVVVQHGRDEPVVYRFSNNFELTPVWNVPADDIATQTLAALANGGFLRGGSSGDLDHFDFDGQMVGSAHAHDAPIIAIDASSDGDLAVTGGANGTVTLWTLGERGPAAQAIIGQFPFPVLDLVIDDTRERVVMAHADGHLEQISFDARAGSAGPVKPAQLFEHNKRDEGKQSRGAKLFNACVACHETGYERGNKMGPPFGGLFGRKAGSVPGYPYSSALRQSSMVWDEMTLSALFDQGPENYLPGTTMPLQRMPRTQDRHALIKHMKQVVEP